MNEDVARTRFQILTFVRFFGVAVAFTGIANTFRRWIEPADFVGYALIMAGILLVTIAPQIMIKKWKNADRS